MHFKQTFETQRFTSTDYIIGTGVTFSDDVLEHILGKPVFLLIDAVFQDLHAQDVQRLTNMLQPIGKLCLKSGEQIKTLSTLDRIIDAMVAAQVPKHGVLLIMGGGTICDVGATAATVFRRGIGLVMMPTTLLSQIDAAIGGKNGVNHSKSKNLVGHFLHPALVACDMHFLSSLSTRDLTCGIAEAIKVLATTSRSAFETHFLTETSAVHAEAMTDWRPLVEDSVHWKLELLQDDPFEMSSQRVLNYGHAFCHLIEDRSNYALSHGEAVLFGMILENQISRVLGIASKEDLDALDALIRRHVSQDSLRHWLPFEHVQSSLSGLRDIRRGKMNFVCIDTLGSCQIVDDASDGLLAEAWRLSEQRVFECAAS